MRRRAVGEWRIIERTDRSRTSSQQDASLPLAIAFIPMSGLSPICDNLERKNFIRITNEEQAADASTFRFECYQCVGLSIQRK